MAQTGFTPIQTYYSTTASAVPSAGNLLAGELAINTVDEKLYFKNSSGVVKQIASTAAPGFGGTASSTVELLTGTAIASAATINLDTATGNRVHVTGTTAITAVTLTRGPRTVIFDAALTLTHNATTNNLPGAANITTAAGDRAIYESDGTTVYCVSYVKVSGTAVVAAVSGGLTLIAVLTPASGVVSISATNITPYKSIIATVSGITLNTADYLVFAMSLNNGSTYPGGNIISNNSTNPISYIQLYQTDIAAVKSGIIITNNTAAASVNINLGGTGIVNAVRISTNNSNTFTGAGSIYIYGNT